MTSEEREQRRKRLAEAATEAICQRGKLEVALEPKDIRRILNLAGHLKLPAGVMIRNWILEELESECAFFLEEEEE